MNGHLSPSPLPQPPSRVRFGVLGFACALSMITYLDRVCFGTVAGHIKDEFDLSDTQRGMLFTAFALAYALFEVPSGWLGDVFGPRKTLIRIVLWWSFFTALTGMLYPSVLSGSLTVGPWEVGLAFLAMLAVRFLFGMGEAGAYPNIARAFHNWFPFHERGSAQGAVWMAGRFAGGVTPLVVLALIVTATEGGRETVHWRHAFWIFGCLGVVWCGLFFWWFRDRP
jgi:MFS family permease